MNNELQMLELYKFLYERINAPYFKNNNPQSYYQLYDDFITSSRNTKECIFNKEDQINLYIEIAYRYHIAYGIDTFLTRKGINPPYTIPKNISIYTFKHQLLDYQRIPSPTEEYNNLFEYIMFFITEVKLQGHNSSWKKFYSDKIEGKQSSYDKDVKIYVCPENNSLHKVASELIKKCDIEDIKYKFKINSDEYVIRADNLVIYATYEELPKYIKILNEIKEENPNIIFRQAHLLSYPYNNFINLAPAEKTGYPYSHSSIICEKIWYLRRSAQDYNTFFEQVKKVINDSLVDIIKLCDDLKKDQSYKK